MRRTSAETITQRPDSAAAVTFLQSAYAPGDWLALFAKSSKSSETLQRVRSRDWFFADRVQSWLRALNAQGWNLYISVNALTPGQRSRRRAQVAAVRHVMLDADVNGSGVVGRITACSDLPMPSFIIHSSLGRLHVLWRVTGFSCDHVEGVQRRLARVLGTDRAATPCSQTTRLPGFRNHKYAEAPVVAIDYADAESQYGPDDFPEPDVRPEPIRTIPPMTAINSVAAQERARRYLATIEPAVEGQHGDQHTFRVCCRLTRGFALSHQEALALLGAWNTRCRPPWTTEALEQKLRHARRYGREPIGGLLQKPEA